MTPNDARLAFRGAVVVAVTPKVSPIFDDALLADLPRLRTIVLHATGFEAFDLHALARHEVALHTLPAYSTESVAAHALAMMLTLSTRLHLADARSRGLVPGSTSLRGFELAGRTLGIVGLGRIGTRLATMAQGIGLRVIANDIRPRAAPGVEMTSLPALLDRADVLSLNCPRVHGAPAMIGARHLTRLPTGAIMVNVSRAELVDNRAVAWAVRSGQLRGYAVDDAVFTDDDTADLVREGRVLQTGHSAWWTDEVLERGARHWVDTMIDALVELEIGVPHPEVAARGH